MALPAFRELDFKASNVDLKSILFDVELRDLYVLENSRDKIFQDFYAKVKSYKAIVNLTNNEVLSVVTGNYKIVTNEEAIALGKKAFVELFPSVNEKELVIFKIISSARKTFCHIDLVHKNIKLSHDSKEWEQDSWYPYLRITNSYNKTYALSFELGFVRKLCSNGVIFNKKTVRVKYNHTKTEIPYDILPDVSALKKLEADFISSLYNLKRFYVKSDFFTPITLKALNIKEKSYTGKEQQFDNLVSSVEGLNTNYINKDGENAYALFNVMSDLVSNNPNDIMGYHLAPNSYYKKISHWMLSFASAMESRDFTIERYLNS
ncbi:MAG: hypothetical protein WAT43_08480 [Chitinophagales bacterium]|nr:DUF932 domain-containing protein [Bacteroidota bacterium]